MCVFFLLRFMYFCGLFLLYLFFQWYFRVARMMMSGDGGDGSSSVWRLWLAVNSRRHNHRRTTNKMVRRKLWIICWWTGGKGAGGVWGEVLELNESRCEHSQHWVKYYSVCDSDDGGGNNSLLAPVLWCWWHVQTFAHAHYYLSNGGWKEGVNIWFYMITAAQHTESVFVST